MHLLRNFIRNTYLKKNKYLIRQKLAFEIEVNNLKRKR